MDASSMLYGNIRDDIRRAAALTKDGLIPHIIALRSLERQLGPDETVEQIIAAVFHADRGITVLTGSRLFFYSDNVIKKANKDFRFENVTSIVWNSGLMFGAMAITTADGQRHIIDKVRKGEGAAFVEGVRGHLSGAKGHGQAEPQPSSALQASAPAASEDVLEQLSKLGKLRDLGVLTAEEFDAKKAELLSRL